MFLIPNARPNIHYETRFTSDDDPDARFPWLLNWLRAIYKRRATDPTRTRELAMTRTRPNAVSGIIYVTFRTDCDALAKRLRENSIGAMPYHAGLSAQDRTTCQQQWIANAPGYDIVVATTAFGMGIDKQDVRFVVHWNLPKSFEGYYQEAGRAGRDGKAAACVMFYSREERDRVSSRISRDAIGHARSSGGGEDSGRARTNSNGKNNSSNLTSTFRRAQVRSREASFARLVAYCEDTTQCRHAMINNFFEDGNYTAAAIGANAPVCDFACDFCKDPEDLKARKDKGLASEDSVSVEMACFQDFCAGALPWWVYVYGPDRNSR